jgi:hypothetical protein
MKVKSGGREGNEAVGESRRASSPAGTAASEPAGSPFKTPPSTCLLPEHHLAGSADAAASAQTAVRLVVPWAAFPAMTRKAGSLGGPRGSGSPPALS